MQRVCFTLTVRRDRLEEYRQRHRAIWPAMRSALSEAGWNNYTLFLRDDGLLVGYLQCEEFQGAKAAMKSLEVNQQWQEEMAPFFDNINVGPDEAMQPLEEIFHLD